MHDWYTHMYFTDDLPLRRLSESNFHSLAQLKASTGNVVQPFLSSVRPRNPPPNLPIPLSVLQAAIGSPVSSDMVDPFGRLGAHSPPTASAPSNTRINPDQPRQQFQQAYQHGYVPDRNTAISPNPFTPQTSFDHQLSSPAASYATSPAQGWASSSIASRLNGGYGSVGMPTPIGSATTPHEQLPALHSPGTGGAAYRDSPENSFVSPPISISANPVSPWAVPPLSQHPQNRQHLQQQQVSPLPPWQPSGPARETWPQQRQEAPYHTSMYDDISSQNPMHSGMDEEVRLETEAEEQPDMGEEELGSSISEPAVETPVEPGSPPPQLPEAVLAPKAAPTVESVWGQESSPSVKTPSAPPSRKLSLVAPASAQLPLPPSSSGTNAPATKLPPAPASLPPKPVAARQGSVIDVKPMGPQTPENTSTTARPAPWTTGMGKDDKERRISIAGPSLRDIQEGQAKQTAARKRAVAEARAATGSPTQTPDLDEMPQNMTWGLPSQGQNTATVTSPAAASPPSGPVWGGGEAGPKKTLTQIQDEEEKRKVRVAAQARAVQATAGAAAGSKRGYADLAATTTVSAPEDTRRILH